MCIEDIAISRRSSYRRYTVVAGTNLILPANQQRLALIGIVDGTAGGRVAISELASDVAGGFGAVLSWSNAPGTTDVFSTLSIRMDFRSHPSLIHSRLFVSTTYAVMAMLEVTADNVIQSAVDKYLKKLESG